MKSENKEAAAPAQAPGQSGKKCKSNSGSKASGKSERRRDSDGRNSEVASVVASSQEPTTAKSALVNKISVSFELDVIATMLFFLALGTRLYKLDQPRSIVFDELHFGKHVGLYLKKIFFFDSHPPLGKQLIAAAAYLAGFDGQFKFDKIGTKYPDAMPLYAMRCIPAVCGSLLIPAVYYLMLELGFAQWVAALAGFLLVMDNALLTQSRFILMESMLLLFSVFGLLCALKFVKSTKTFSLPRWLWLVLASTSLTCCVCVKYIGVFSCLLGLSLLARSYLNLVCDPKNNPLFLTAYLVVKALVVVATCSAVYLSIFYVHLSHLSKAGPHDGIMTSAFQVSLEGGLASVTKGQPMIVGHGSQVTLRNTFGQICWLHSHVHLYPILYPEGRGSSHQQQVTCYLFKDANNWWIVKRPDVNDLAASNPVDAIRHGDVIQLVHGITGRVLNSHDVAAPMSPRNQEVSCYVDYNLSMPAYNLWEVDIVNKESVGDVWNAIFSQVRLIHVNSSQALKFSGQKLPSWGFEQFEIVTDTDVKHPNTVWSVEEHRYTKYNDEVKRAADMVNAEMLPTKIPSLTFWDKLTELQYKMLFTYQEPSQHMYSSEPLEWPFVSSTIAYWVSPTSNAQVHLIGNVVIWWTASLGFLAYCFLLAFYLLRRRRRCFDISNEEWSRFVQVGQVLTAGYVLHYVPFFFMDRILFLHHYLPAFVFKTLLLCAVLDHLNVVLRSYVNRKMAFVLLRLALVAWCLWVVWMFRKLSVLSYGTTPLTERDLVQLKMRDAWHFILHHE